MNASDFMVIAILAIILFSAGWYIYKAKKSGKKCIGCPEGGSCSSSGCSGNCAHCSSCGSSKS